VFPLDADNLAHPSFVERCVEVLSSDDGVAYVNAWAQYVDEDGVPYAPPVDGYQPISNDFQLLATRNVAGDATAVFRREIFTRGFLYSVDVAASYEDWLLYRQLAQARIYGHTIPERLLSYRVRRDSMLREVGHPHHERLLAEMRASIRYREMTWT
jgi:hypothetical protein